MSLLKQLVQDESEILSPSTETCLQLVTSWMLSDYVYLVE